MRVAFPHVSGWLFPITCIVTYRTCIVAVSNVYPQLYPSSKCVFDTLRYTLDTKSRLWWGLSSVSSSGYRANFGDFCIVHVSCMYREISKKVYRILYRYMYRAYFDQYRKRIENDVSSFCIVFVSSMYLTCTRSHTFRSHGHVSFVYRLNVSYTYRDCINDVSMV